MKSMWSSHIPNIDMFPLIVGAEPDDDEDDDETPAGGAGAGAGGDEGRQQSEDENSKGDPQKKIQAQDEIISRKQQALDEAEQELQELRDFKKNKDAEALSAEEKRDREVQEVTEERDKLRETVQELLVQNAFLNSNEFTWHKPEQALALADLSEVEVIQGKDGKYSIKDPEKLKTAIKDLAEDSPHLLKKSTTDEESKERKPWKGNTGTPPDRKQSKEAAGREKLVSKYPALRK